MDLNPDEVRIKQEMADACERVVCIADATKWQRSALLSFVPPAGCTELSPTPVRRRTRSRRGERSGRMSPSQKSPRA